MIPFGRAREIVLKKARSLPTERIQIQDSLCRALAQDIRADRDLPPHNLSAVDGFACRSKDLGGPLEVIETIPAGYIPSKRIGPGQCARIMTGAPVPHGADVVVMFEDTAEKCGVVRVTTKSARSNIRVRGEDLKAREIALRRGAVITPAGTAVLAAFGYATVTVYKRPVVGIIATGSELVSAELKPKGAQIRDSNSPQLCGQIVKAGCIPKFYGIAKDTPARIDRLLKKALDECDVVLISGGVSVGDYDWVPGVLKENRVALHFEKVAVKPGKPTVFGTRGKKYVFGLPGNPVATFILFEVLVKPFLWKLMGSDVRPLEINAPLAAKVKRKTSTRTEFIPVHMEPNGAVTALRLTGSAHIHAFAHANAFAELPVGTSELAAGSLVRTTFL